MALGSKLGVQTVFGMDAAAYCHVDCVACPIMASPLAIQKQLSREGTGKEGKDTVAKGKTGEKRQASVSYHDDNKQYWDLTPGKRHHLPLQRE